MFSVTAPLFAQALTLTVADTSEIRARYDTGESGVVSPTGGAPGVPTPGTTDGDGEYALYFDAMTQPSATLLVGTRRASYTLAYAPTFTWLAIGNDEQYSQAIFHTVNLAATLNWKRTSLDLSQSFSYGTTNYRLAFVPAPTGAPVPVPDADAPDPLTPDDPLPGQEPTLNTDLTTGSSVSTISLTHALSRTQSLSEFVNYTYSTGIGSDRDLYPKQRGGGVGVAYSLELNARDSLDTTLDAGVFYTDPLATSTTGEVRRSIIGTLRQSWTREWAEDLELSLGVGLSYGRTDEGDATAEVLLLDILPVGNTSIDYTWGQGGALYTATASLGTAPYVNRFTGVVDPRVFWAASLAREQRRLTLTATVAGSQSSDSELAEEVGAPPAVRAVSSQTTASASLLATYEAFERFFLRAGVQATTSVALTPTATSDEDDDTRTRPVYFAFLGVSYSYDVLRSD